MIIKKINNNFSKSEFKNKLDRIKKLNFLEIIGKIKNLLFNFPIFSIFCIYLAQCFYEYSLEGRKDLQWMHAHLGLFGVYIFFSTVLFVMGFVSLGRFIIDLTKIINANNDYKKYDLYNMKKNNKINKYSQLLLKKFNISLVLYRNILLLLFVKSLIISFFKVTKDKGATLINHGQYNLIAFTTLLLIYLIGFLSWYLIFKNWTIKNTIIRLIVFIILIYIIFSIRNIYVIKNWPIGIDGKKLMFKDDGNSKVCKIESDFIAWPSFVPKGSTRIITGSSECPSESEQFSRLTNGFLTMDNCKEEFKQYTLSPVFWEEQKKFDTFTNDFKYYEKLFQGKTQTLQYRGPVRIQHETVMAICGNQTEIHYQNLKNQQFYQRTLNNFNSPKIKVHADKVKLPNHPDQKYNKKPIDILFLMIDALSRAQFKSAMPSTFETLQSIQTQGHSKVFQFLRYHSLKPFSDPNTMAMYNGYNRVQYDEVDYANGINDGGDSTNGNFTWEKNPMFYQSFRNDSYVTTWVTGLCQDWFQHYLKMDKEEGSVDHEIALPFCSPQLHPPEKPFGIFEGPYSIRRRCLGDKHVHETIFQYINQFWENYKDVGKILHTTFMDGHEGTNEVIQIADKGFQNFLQNDLRPKLNDTFLILASDHGQHMSGYYMWSKGGKIEVAMPMLYLVLPTWFLEKYPDIEIQLLENENKLSTPFQLYDTIRTLSTFPEFGGIDIKDPNGFRNENQKGFLGKIPDDITCNKLGIPHDFCVCK
ncbi:hypothetical protein RB653_010630 [Dictyostelium firmibasis]|uniref:Uncharacterized protein n=1 Tax=Dictyostelium firmibasis TaxID=79012 RepID=A0AAN7YN65_9MYCE